MKQNRNRREFIKKSSLLLGLGTLTLVGFSNITEASMIPGIPAAFVARVTSVSREHARQYLSGIKYPDRGPGSKILAQYVLDAPDTDQVFPWIAWLVWPGNEAAVSESDEVLNKWIDGVWCQVADAYPPRHAT